MMLVFQHAGKYESLVQELYMFVKRTIAFWGRCLILQFGMESKPGAILFLIRLM